MKKKGFTLIELLAVIVVLAIIALIATPMVLDTIEKSRKGAASSSTYSYISEVETKLASYMLKHNGASYNNGKYNVTKLQEDLGIELKGTIPSEGNICIGENGQVIEASIKMNDYIVHYDGKTATTTDLKEIEDIACSSTSSEPEPPTEDIVYENGTEIYFNPETGKLCNDYVEGNSLNQYNNGCMRWYIFNDSENATTVNMILDHNTTRGVAWNSSGNNADGMKEVADASNISRYDWLYNYTDCLAYGCTKTDENSFSYWTSTPTVGNSNYVWRVSSTGCLALEKVNATWYGIRPVITISKLIIL